MFSILSASATSSVTMMNTQIPSAEDVKTSFVCSSFDHIEGEPAHESIAKIERQATRNAAATEVALQLPHNNLAGIVE